jgi:hypothetical protein
MKLRAILVLGLAVAGLALVSPSAQAAPVYPPVTCPTLSLSTTNPVAGESISVTGTMFAPHAKVRLELQSTTDVLAHVTTDGQGSFKTTVKLPAGVTGRHKLVAIGGDVAGQELIGCPADPFQTINIQGGSSGTSSPGGTAFTGLDVLGLLAAAAVLLAGGVLLQRSGKRRRAYAGRH